MRKTVAMALVALLCVGLALVAGCSQSADENSVVGKWTLEQVTAEDGTTVTGSEMSDAMGGEVTYEFKDDGTLVTAVGDVSVDGTWTQDGDTVSVDVGGQAGEGTVSGDTLTIASGGGTSEFKRA